MRPFSFRPTSLTSSLPALVILALVLTACRDQPGPAAVADVAVAAQMTSSSDVCDQVYAFPDGDRNFNTNGRFTVAATDNNKAEAKEHYPGWVCSTARSSTVFASPDGEQTLYHNWVFSPAKVYSFMYIGRTVTGDPIFQFDCSDCDFSHDRRFTSTAPAPGYRGGTYRVRATIGPLIEGNSLPLESRTPAVCTLDGNMSPATATFHETGTCLLEIPHPWEGGVYQSFPVVLPLSAEVPVGEGVAVTPINGEDEPAPVMLTFDNVTTAGTATVTTETVDAESETPPPANFYFGDPPTYYEITIDGELTFEGAVRLCITYPEGHFYDPNEPLILMHWDAINEEWYELINQDWSASTRTICADTYSFSPFAIAQAVVGLSGGGDENGQGKRKAKGKAKGRN